MSADTLQIAYGTYVHDVGECEFSFKRVALTGQSGNPWAERITVDITGQLLGSSVADMNVKVDKLINNYRYDGYDFRVLNAAGVNQRLSILSANTLAGVQVKIPPSFPTMQGAAYVTYLPYQIQLVAEVPITDPETVLDSFSESLSFSGGGPIYTHLETRVGYAQKQRPTQHTVYRATQEGSAVGLYTTPLIPGPLWPQHQVRAGRLRRIGGRLVGAGSARRYMYHGVRWSYEFESIFPLFGSPNNWGAE